MPAELPRAEPPEAYRRRSCAKGPVTPLEAASRWSRSVDRAGRHIGSHPPNRARRYAIAPHLVDQEGRVSSRCFDHGLATAVGMTFQVSETTRTTHAIRSTVFATRAAVLRRADGSSGGYRHDSDFGRPAATW